MNKKTCTKCNKSKPITKFSKQPVNVDGRKNICLECEMEDQRERRAKKKKSARIEFY